MQRSVALSVYSLHFIFSWNFFGILKGPLQPKRNYFSRYMEFWINQLRKNTDVYCIQTVCKMVQGISREKQSLSLLVLQLSLGKNLILLAFLDSNIHKHENFKLTVLYGHT